MRISDWSSDVCSSDLCSDNEVNIKIALNREVMEGRLALAKRNKLLTDMTDDVAGLVLEDNRLQTLALSIMENDGALSLPSYVRAIEIFETAGRSEEHTSELQSLMRTPYAVFCLK